MEISVVICTHSAPRDRLGRVIEALSRQTLGRAAWELVVVDNLSEPPVLLPESMGLNARVVREERLGLTPARLRGFREAVAPLICFVDDDNLLEPDYLERAVDIARAHPYVGVFSGSISGEFEAPPPPWLRPYTHGLAVTEITEDSWSNDRFSARSMPCGAGLCVRREVAMAYEAGLATSPLRRLLGRRGRLLLSGEDNDLAWTAIDEGLGVGRFHRLRVVHMIPRTRLGLRYLVELHAGFVVSTEVLLASRGLPPIHGGALHSLLRAVRFGRLGPWIWLRAFAVRRAVRQLMRAREADTPFPDR